MSNLKKYEVTKRCFFHGRIREPGFLALLDPDDSNTISDLNYGFIKLVDEPIKEVKKVETKKVIEGEKQPEPPATAEQAPPVKEDAPTQTKKRRTTRRKKETSRTKESGVTSKVSDKATEA